MDDRSKQMLCIFLVRDYISKRAKSDGPDKVVMQRNQFNVEVTIPNEWDDLGYRLQDAVLGNKREYLDYKEIARQFIVSNFPDPLDLYVAAISRPRTPSPPRETLLRTILRNKPKKPKKKYYTKPATRQPRNSRR